MDKIRHIGEIDQDGKIVKIFLLDGDKFEYISEKDEKEFLESHGFSQDDFEKVKISDPLLEKAIRESLNEPGEDLTKGDLKNVETLDISSYGILDFSSLENLSNLKELRASGVENLSKNLHYIKDLINLEYLDISHCNIREIDPDNFNSLCSLKEVNLNGNMIVQIPDNIFCTNSNIRALHVSGTGIKDLEFVEGLKNLEELYANNNLIKSLLGLRFVQNIKILDISNNNIASIRMARNLRELKVLSIRENMIEDISNLRVMTKLEELYASHNLITNIEVLKNMKNLKILDLNYNNVKDISILRNLKELRELNLKANNIHTVQPLKRLDKLEILNLEGNTISDYSCLTDIYDDLIKKDF